MSLQEDYKKTIKDELVKEFAIKNVMAIPKLTKIVVNCGTGEALKSKEIATQIAEDLATITGQKVKITKARVSIAGFNLRLGMNVGMVVTLRGKRMYDFYEKLVKIVLPRLRDFRGVPLKSFDQAGNYTLGIVEHTVFPEIDLAKVTNPRGMEITFVTNVKNVEQSRKLLELMGMPFEKLERRNISK
ncbi:MAG TPA: 50S ribosomal protein L5 [Patescibacteria group bacterium]|nr:50S ribosomal protein L5 [Patescibacteria group bacterium]